MTSFGLFFGKPNITEYKSQIIKYFDTFLLLIFHLEGEQKLSTLGQTSK